MGIFSCDNEQQHSFCCKCYKLLSDESKPCPVCQEPLRGKRNLVLERIIDKIPKFQCRYPECGLKGLTTEPIRAHEDNECPFRLVPCGRCGCLTQLNKLPDHLSKQHGRQRCLLELANSDSCYYMKKANMKKAQDCIEVKLPSGDLLASLGNKKLIFCENWAEIDATSYLFWVSYCGPKILADSFKYTIKIKDRKYGQKKYLFEATTYCVPCDLSHEQMKKSKEGIVLSKKLVDRGTVGEGLENHLGYFLIIDVEK